MNRTLFILSLLLISISAEAAMKLMPARPVSREAISLHDLRMKKRFGIGISAAGPLSIFGMEVDLNLSESWSVGGGIGTGFDYSTFAIKGRYFLIGENVSPYVGLGYARWWASGPTEEPSPSILADRFLANEASFDDGFDVHLFYPVLGVQFMHPIGVSVYAEIQYLVKMFDMAQGPYAGMGVQWYF